MTVLDCNGCRDGQTDRWKDRWQSSGPYHLSMSQQHKNNRLPTNNLTNCLTHRLTLISFIKNNHHQILVLTHYHCTPFAILNVTGNSGSWIKTRLCKIVQVSLSFLLSAAKHQGLLIVPGWLQCYFQSCKSVRLGLQALLGQDSIIQLKMDFIYNTPTCSVCLCWDCFSLQIIHIYHIYSNKRCCPN